MGMLDADFDFGTYELGSASGTNFETYNPNMGDASSGSSFSWEKFGSSLYRSGGGLLETAGKYTEGRAYGTRFSAMASGLDLKGSAFGMAANWANIGLVFPELQKSIIAIQTNIARKQSLEQWQNRISATKARYAKSGVAADAGGMSDTPLKAMLTLLEASAEELRWIDTDKQVREFNEVTLPGIQTRLQESGATYQKDLTRINQNYALRMGKIAKKAAYMQAGLSVIGSGAKAYGAGSSGG
jgi:hypothetical protein